MSKTRKKTPAVAVKVPQSRGEASDALRMIGERNRQLGRIEADMNDTLARVKTDAEAQAAPIRAEAAALLEGLKVWCEANRSAILPKGLKTADLGSGTVSWRHRPASVTVRGVEAVIEACRKMGLQRFIREKFEPNKEAMLGEAAVARQVPGVTIASAGEEFIAEPYETTLEAVA
jgi:phage host-nuclease inhibitor protein Gam